MVRSRNVVVLMHVNHGCHLLKRADVWVFSELTRIVSMVFMA